MRRGAERLELFQTLLPHYKISRVLYPGSFVHITPALVFSKTTYVDSDKQAQKFFADARVLEWVTAHKMYGSKPRVEFYPLDYCEPLPLRAASFDLLLSQYAGFVSQACKRYLESGGLLVANNSHGDASMAQLDEEYEFIGALHRQRNGAYKLVSKDLDEYFMPKKPMQVTKTFLEKTRRGIAYQKTADDYVFRRIR